MPVDHYETLGVSRQATPEGIQKAYRRMARKYHPDRNPGDAQAKGNVQKVQAAFDVLSGPQTRELYARYGSAYETLGGSAAGGPRPGPHPWGAAGSPGPG